MNLPIIDIDGHVREADDLWERYLEPAFRDRAPKIERVPNGQLLFRMESDRYHRKPDESPFQMTDGANPVNPDRALATDPKDRLRAMDEDGIDCGMLFPSAGLYLPAVEDAHFGAALCRAYNNWLADYRCADPRRLMGVGVIPTQDIDLCVHETKRVVQEFGFQGIFVRPNPVRGRRLDDAYYDPLYRLIEQLGVPLMVHEGSGAYLPTAGAERFAGEWFFTHTISHPVEQMLASLSLIAKGTLEKFPGLKVIFLEAGATWLPYWLWRMDEHYEKLPFQVPWLKMRPSEYFQRQCYVSCEVDEPDLGSAVATLGEDHVLFASDYPHWDATFPGVTQTLRNRTDLSYRVKTKILGENSRRILGLE